MAVSSPSAVASAARRRASAALIYAAVTDNEWKAVNLGLLLSGSIMNFNFFQSLEFKLSSSIPWWVDQCVSVFVIIFNV
ncbi:hypothetical protein H6P81_012990 [Aristolochia fimbriata]|uniref:Uncharacterized protein n=1 Tax=Aristolochia fimbriata TaxID=158543 RepID=A0AAV7EH10_ARIFI|nr:hypothetical protein H6P81_012990 [Aristolochia fimbriata]